MIASSVSYTLALTNIKLHAPHKNSSSSSLSIIFRCFQMQSLFSIVSVRFWLAPRNESIQLYLSWQSYESRSYLTEVVLDLDLERWRFWIKTNEKKIWTVHWYRTEVVCRCCIDRCVLIRTTSRKQVQAYTYIIHSHIHTQNTIRSQECKQKFSLSLCLYNFSTTNVEKMVFGTIILCTPRFVLVIKLLVISHPKSINLYFFSSFESKYCDSTAANNDDDDDRKNYFCNLLQEKKIEFKLVWLKAVVFVCRLFQDILLRRYEI